MAEPLKGMFSAIWLKQWYLYQAHIWEVNNWKINEIEHWIQRFQTTNWEEAALLDRVRLLAQALQEDIMEVLINDTSNQEFNFRIAAEVVCQISNHIREYERTQGFHWIFLPQWVANFGLENLQISMEALGVITQLVSAEFAVRPFLLQDQDACKPYFEKWSQAENSAKRRLASEGCRPRLPWGNSFSSFNLTTIVFPQPLSLQVPTITSSILGVGKPSKVGWRWAGSGEAPLPTFDRGTRVGSPQWDSWDFWDNVCVFCIVLYLVDRFLV